MWLLTAAILFVSATSSAQAQWQTRVDVIVYSLSHSESRKELGAAIDDETGKVGDHRKTKMLGLYLKQRDPTGYKEFTNQLKKGIDDWVEGEKKKGPQSPLYGKNFAVCLSPYGINPIPGDVQITIVLNNYPGVGEARPFLPISIKISAGVENTLELIRMILVAPVKEAPHVLPTSSKRSA